VSIGGSVFSDCAELTSVTIPESVSSIGSSAFYKCAKMTMYCIENSYAHQYAVSNSITFSLASPAIEQVSPVTASPSPGAVASGTAVSLSTATSGAEIRYTINGAEPTASSALYTSPISITASTTIRAKAFKSGMTDSDTLIAAYTVTQTPTPTPIPVTGVSLDKTSATLAQGGTLTLAATVSPPNATDSAVSWSSDNQTVATVSGGVVYGNSPGTANITVMTADGGKTASCFVTVTAPIPSDTPTVTVGAVTGKAGDEVDVTVTLANNPGIASFTFKLNFDKTKLQPVSITKGAALTGNITSNINAPGIDLTALDFVSATWTDASNFSGNGVLYTVKFKIKDTVQECAVPLTLVYEEGDVTNQSYGNVDLFAVQGAVNIITFIYGDIFSDNKINGNDAVKLAQYLALWPITLAPSELSAADVYLDGKINGNDAVKLAQYLALWPNITLGTK
jgi:uncharacterized protein YjdB